jgi:hypothetical protein
MSKKQKNTKTAARGESGGLSQVVQMFVVAGSLMLLYHVFVNQPSEAVAQHTGPSKGVVVVDSKSVFGAYMEVMQGRIAGGESFSEAQLNLSGQEFAAEYLRAIKKYRDAGYMVLDKQYALGVPAQSEITKEIGTALNLQVIPSPDPFSAPQIAE